MCACVRVVYVYLKMWCVVCVFVQVYGVVWCVHAHVCMFCFQSVPQPTTDCGHL